MEAQQNKTNAQLEAMKEVASQIAGTAAKAVEKSDVVKNETRAAPQLSEFVKPSETNMSTSPAEQPPKRRRRKEKRRRRKEKRPLQQGNETQAAPKDEELQRLDAFLLDYAQDLIQVDVSRVFTLAPSPAPTKQPTTLSQA